MNKQNLKSGFLPYLDFSVDGVYGYVQGKTQGNSHTTAPQPKICGYLIRQNLYNTVCMLSKCQLS